MRADFEDLENGGFFFTAGDHEALIQRPKSWQDEAMPCGNAIAALGLQRLGLLIGDRACCDSALRALKSVAEPVETNPLYAAGFTRLLAEIEQPPKHIVVRGDPGRVARLAGTLLPGPVAR